MSTSKVTSITIGTNVKLTRSIASGPSLSTMTLMDDVVSVAFESYSEGQINLAPGISEYPLLTGSELVILTSDNPINVTFTQDGQPLQTVSQTTRFSIEGQAGVNIVLSNTSETKTARVSFLTTNKPPVVQA